MAFVDQPEEQQDARPETKKPVAQAGVPLGGLTPPTGPGDVTGGPALPPHPLATSDPMAFAETSLPASDPLSAGSPAPAVNPLAPQAQPAPVGSYPGAQFDADREANHQSIANASTGDQWWAAHNGSARTSTQNGNTVDGFLSSYTPGGPGSTPQLDAEWQQAKTANDRRALTANHGITNTPEEVAARLAGGGGPLQSDVAKSIQSPAELASQVNSRFPGGAALPSGDASLAPQSQSSARLAPPTGPSVGGSPSGGVALPAAGALPPQSQLGGVLGSRGVGLSEIDPNNSLLTKTIAPDNSVDRVKLNQDALQSTINNILRPEFDSAQRATTAQSFGAGRGVSGMNRTAQGNVLSDYNRKIADLGAQSSRDAATGGIQDMYNNVGIAQQQQGFQAGQQQNAFGQDYATRQLEEALTNGAFGRASAQEQAGYNGNPSDVSLILSRIFGDQASGAGASAANLFRQQGAASGGGGTDVEDMIKRILPYLQSGGSSNQNPGADDGQ